VVRRFWRLSAVGILLASSGAHAGILTNATWFQVTQGVPMTRTYYQLGIDPWDNFSTQNSIAVNLSYPFFSTTAFARGTQIDLAQQITFGGPQAITATANMANGTPGIPGTVIVMSAIHVGVFTNTFLVTGALHGLTVDFYAWTPGPFAFTGLTSKGQPLPNVTAAGSFNLTEYGGGTVTLVSPSKVSIDGSLAQRRTASFTKLVLSFVPEPSTLLLLGGSALALVLAGRRAQRS
jgi:hypothetical protein